MANLPISEAAALDHATITDEDLIPVLDVSASTGSKGSKITVGELRGKILGGGGGSVTEDDVAWLSSNGSDATGEGSPANPYRSGQKAVDDGFRVLRGGVGNFGAINVSSDDAAVHLTLLGVGRANTSFGDITLPAGSTLQGNGRGNVRVESIFMQGAAGSNGVAGVGLGSNGSDGEPGVTAADSYVGFIYVQEFIFLKGGTGGNGGNGSIGGDAPDADEGEIHPGNGGAGGDGGAGGELMIEDCDYNYAFSNGGDGGNGGLGGGSGALDGVSTGGAAGTLILKRCNERGGHYMSGGSGNTPGVSGSSSIEYSIVSAAGEGTDAIIFASVVSGVFVAN